MRAARFFAAISITAGLVAVVACQEPTQVTVDVRLDTAKCSEIHGTLINVGVFPEDTQDKVKQRYPNAQTTDCDEASARIGTLVVTPSDAERGSIIVITSYGPKHDPTECQPPLFTDCIVARRQFTFTKHRRLSLPITIDPTCVNVPCDAFSTCRKGACFPSEAEPCGAGERCLEPGETAGGGTDLDAAVTPDAPGNDTGPGPDSGADADASQSDGPLSDGPLVDGPPLVDGAPDGPTAPDSAVDAGPGVTCDGNNRIICPPVPMACVPTGTNACCRSSMPGNPVECAAKSGDICPSSHPLGRYCCSTADCGPNEECPAGMPGQVRQCCSTVDSGQALGPAPTCAAAIE